MREKIKKELADLDSYVDTTNYDYCLGQYDAYVKVLGWLDEE